MEVFAVFFDAAGALVALALAVAAFVGFLDAAGALVAFAVVGDGFALRAAAFAAFWEAAKALVTFSAVFFTVDRDFGVALVTPFLRVVVLGFFALEVAALVLAMSALDFLDTAEAFEALALVGGGFVLRVAAFAAFWEAAKALVAFSAVFFTVDREFGVALVTPFLRVVVSGFFALEVDFLIVDWGVDVAFVTSVLPVVVRVLVALVGLAAEVDVFAGVLTAFAAAVRAIMS